MSREISRREFMKVLSVGTGAFMLAPSGLVAIPEGTASTTEERVAYQLGNFPRNQTVIIRMLTGRPGTPDNFNQWVGWKNPDRGMQNLADEALWAVDFATGKNYQWRCRRRPEVQSGL